MSRPLAKPARRRFESVAAYVLVGGCILLETAVCRHLSPDIDDGVAAMLNLLTVMLAASTNRLRLALFAATTATLAWTYVFLPPPHSLAITLPEVFPLAVFFVAAAGTACLTAATKRHALEAEQREQVTSALYGLSLALLSHVTLEESLRSFEGRVSELCRGVSCGFWWRDADGQVLSTLKSVDSADLGPPEEVRSVLLSGERLDRRRPDDTGALYLPLLVGQEVLGVMEARSGEGASTSDATLLGTVANHAALAVHRNRLEKAAGAALGQLEAERLKTSLLASVSHDLRTPLASIKAAATGISLDDIGPEETARTLVTSIVSNADRLDRLVRNLLNMSRLEAGAWQPSKELYPLSEILATVLGRLDELEASRVRVEMPLDLPLIPLDGQQIEQVLWNLLENALKYSPSSSPLELTAHVSSDALSVTLMDRGEGIPVGEEIRIFQKFYRAHRGGERGVPGVGMGLAICREIIEAHDGRIVASNRAGGGAVFTFTLPLLNQKQVVQCPAS